MMGKIMLFSIFSVKKQNETKSNRQLKTRDGQADPRSKPGKRFTCRLRGISGVTQGAV